MNYHDQLIEHIVEPYREEHGDEFSTAEAAAWAIQQKKWKPSLKSQIELLREGLSEAMRSDRRVVDGRKVRQYHCIRRTVGEYVQTVWAHIDVATQDFMEDSFARRRKVLASNAYQLHSDVVFWNENKNTGSPIQILFDFTDDNADRDA